MASRALYGARRAGRPCGTSRPDNGACPALPTLERGSRVRFPRAARRSYSAKKVAPHFHQLRLSLATFRSRTRPRSRLVWWHKQQRPRPEEAGEGGPSGAHHARVDAPPSSCATLKASRRTLHPASVSAGGLPGFFGPYPSAIRDESRCRVVMRLLTKTLHEVVNACQEVRAMNAKTGHRPRRSQR